MNKDEYDFIDKLVMLAILQHDCETLETILRPSSAYNPAGLFDSIEQMRAYYEYKNVS
jgi:hypothetical protein